MLTAICWLILDFIEAAKNNRLQFLCNKNFNIQTTKHLSVNDCSLPLKLDFSSDGDTSAWSCSIIAVCPTLLGWTVPELESKPKRSKILQRRGQHLDLPLQELEEWREGSKQRPITYLNRQAEHEFEFERYPSDVKFCYQRIRTREYLPNPLRCYKCNRFGHTSRGCRSEETCQICSQSGHSGGSHRSARR